MDDLPRLRPVEAFPIQQEGKTLVCLRDPQQFSQTLVVSPAVYFILSHFDGRHSPVEVQESYARRTGQVLLTDDLNKIIALLDSHFYLHSPRFRDHKKKIVDDFRRQPVRLPSHAGTVYRETPEGLRAQLRSHFESPDGPGMPQHNSRPTPKAVVAPHIDFHRGGPAYAWAYKELAESAGADLYILLGTSHCAGESPFVATLKDFATPLGAVETAKEFISRLQAAYKGDLFADEFLHRTEHSLEFQVVYLKYVSELQAALSKKARPFKIVPLLVTSFHSNVLSGRPPDEDERVGEFLKILGDVAANETRQVCFVAGVDLAHVGMQFGDQEPITPEFLKWVEEEDRRLITKLGSLDSKGFFDGVAKDHDRRRICGFSPLYSLTRLLDGSRGQLLKYSQAFTQDTGSAVTFTSMVFD